MCFSNAHCTDPDSAACKTSDHVCVPCLVEADCMKSTFGPHCDGASCQCSADAECATSPRGPHCSAGATQKACGCQADGECAASAFGKRCIASSDPALSRCACAANTDCPMGKTCDLVAGHCSGP
jgi:hypothetical protein